MKSIPVSSILYFLLSLGVLFVNANTFTDSQIFPKWMFMFTGLGVIGCFFSFYLFRGKRFICNAKLLQKSEMRKDIVIELSYKGFS